MTMLTVVTTARALTAWLDALLWMGFIAAGIAVANYGRSMAKATALDIIQIWAAWQQAKIDADHNRAKMALYAGEARLLLQDQRRQLLADLDGEL
jgi:hypothetical protein